MSTNWKIYTLAIISFLVGTSEYILSGILDKVSLSFGVSIASAGQLITIFSLVYALCTPVLMALTASMDRRKLIVSALGVFVVSNILAFVLLWVWTIRGCTHPDGAWSRSSRGYGIKYCCQNRS